MHHEIVNADGRSAHFLIPGADMVESPLDGHTVLRTIDRFMDNPSLIVRTLDSHLDHAVRLVLYGRAALQLGFAGAPPETAESKDVDAIIPLGELDSLSADDAFWVAQEATQTSLRPQQTGRYSGQTRR